MTTSPADVRTSAAEAALATAGGGGAVETTSHPSIPTRLVEAARRSTRDREHLERLAVSLLDEHRAELALQVLGVAAEVAWFDVTGERTSAAMEAALLEVGQQIGPWPQCEGRRTGPSKVLHVVTEAYESGGHTRTVLNWIATQDDAEHSVVLTRQRCPAPTALTDVVVSPGHISQLEGSLADRALALRQLASSADLVVMHVHPYDVIAAAALVHPGRDVPTVLVDHADHVFWVGTWAVDRVLCLRESLRRVAVARRGFHDQRTRVLPIPLGRTAPRAAQTSERSLLAVTSPYKCLPLDGDSIAVLVDGLLAQDPDVVVRVVGVPEGDETWAPVRGRYGTRVQLLGQVTDLAELRASSRVHLDSFPIASSTSWLESAAAGLPVVSYRPPSTAVSDFTASMPSDSAAIVVSDAPTWRSVVAALLDDADHAAEVGTRAASIVRRVHLDAWSEALHVALEGVCALPLAQRTGLPVDASLRRTDTHIAHTHRLSGQLPSIARIAASWGLAPAGVLPPDGQPTAADVSVILTLRGGEDDVISALQGVLESCGPLGRLDVQCLDLGLDDPGARVLRALESDLRVEWDAVSPRAIPDAAAAASSASVLLVSGDVHLTPEGCRALWSELATVRGPVGVVGEVVDPGGDPVSLAGLECSGVLLAVPRSALADGVVSAVRSAGHPFSSRARTSGGSDPAPSFTPQRAPGAPRASPGRSGR